MLGSLLSKEGWREFLWRNNKGNIYQIVLAIVLLMSSK